MQWKKVPWSQWLLAENRQAVPEGVEAVTINADTGALNTLANSTGTYQNKVTSSETRK